MEKVDKELVAEATLREAISNRMAKEFSVRPGVFWCPVLTRPDDPNVEPNWILSIDADRVPEGYLDAWNQICHEFENKYNIMWDDIQP